MNIQERLKKVRQFSGLSVNGFAAKIGVSRARFANYLEDRDPDFDVLFRICREYPNISSEWLLTGEGPMEKGVAETEIVANKESSVGDVAVKLILERDEKLIRENERLLLQLQQMKQEIKPEKGA